MVNDHDLLLRIDERLGYMAKTVEINTGDIKSLKVWKNKTLGVLGGLGFLTGYGLM